MMKLEIVADIEKKHLDALKELILSNKVAH
jgi:hypothetical protein